MSMGPTDRKHPDHGDPSVTVTDHAYIGNACSGFGGELICEHLILERGPRFGERCGLDLLQHRKPEPGEDFAFFKHREDVPATRYGPGGPVVPRHRADVEPDSEPNNGQGGPSA